LRWCSETFFLIFSRCFVDVRFDARFGGLTMVCVCGCERGWGGEAEQR
jgi:hypothetical protein